MSPRAAVGEETVTRYLHCRLRLLRALGAPAIITGVITLTPNCSAIGVIDNHC